MTTWYGTDDATRLIGAWPDAPIVNEELCGFILDTAKLQVIEYAPEATDLSQSVARVLLQHGQADRLEEVLAVLDLTATAAPFNYVLAQLQQAKNLWAAGRANEDGAIGGEGFSFVPRPLDKTIKAMIRPTSGSINAL